MLICGGVTLLECACSRGKPETARKVVSVSHHGDKRCPELQPENLVYPPRTRSDPTRAKCGCEAAGPWAAAWSHGWPVSLSGRMFKLNSAITPFEYESKECTASLPTQRFEPILEVNMPDQLNNSVQAFHAGFSRS